MWPRECGPFIPGRALCGGQWEASLGLHHGPLVSSHDACRSILGAFRSVPRTETPGGRLTVLWAAAGGSMTLVVAAVTIYNSRLFF